MKHAYLIIVHHEFEILQKLIYALDDYRNDIYVHFDRKISDIPKMEVSKAGYFVIEERIDVKWGDISQIQSEYVLFEAAIKNGIYDYYHLLSGVDMPLKSQNEIHTFFEVNKGYEFIGYVQGDISKEIDRKVRRYHLFPKSYRSNKRISHTLQRILRALFLRFQFLIGLKRNSDIEFKKGTSWVSITGDLVKYIIKNKDDVMQRYRNTFCADEIFLHTLCWNSEFRNKIYDIHNEERGCKRLIGWKNGKIEDWQDKDYNMLIKNDSLFARKFSSSHPTVVDKILNFVK